MTIIQSGIDSTLATVDATTKGLNVVSVGHGGVSNFSENDAGATLGTKYLKSPETSLDYRLRVGIDTILFEDNFNATTQNTNNWYYAFTTMTASQPGAGTLNFGTVQGTATSHGAYLKSYQHFPFVGSAPVCAEFMVGQFTASLVTNEVFVFGFGVPASAAIVPTDGVWFQITNSGIIGVASYNSTVVQTGVLLDINTMTLGTIYKFAIVFNFKEIEFWKDDVLIGTLTMSTLISRPTIQGSSPIFMQKYCTGAVSNTNTMRISNVVVSVLDVASNIPWAHQMSKQGKAYVGQNGSTQGKLSLWTNNTAPTAAALTNTTSAFTGLGGIVSVLPTLTVGTDGILMSYLNPISTNNITGRNLVITGVTIHGAVTVLFAGGPVIYALALAFGNVAVSLASTETASFATNTSHSPRIMPIGIDSFAATAPLGALGNKHQLTLHSPICVRPGEYIEVIARNMGVVTTSGAVTYLIAFDGYFE